MEGDGDVKMEEAGAATIKDDSAPGTPIPATVAGDVAMVESNGIAGASDAAAKVAAPVSLWVKVIMDNGEDFR